MSANNTWRRDTHLAEVRKWGRQHRDAVWSSGAPIVKSVLSLLNISKQNGTASDGEAAKEERKRRKRRGRRVALLLVLLWCTDALKFKSDARQDQEAETSAAKHLISTFPRPQIRRLFFGDTATRNTARSQNAYLARLKRNILNFEDYGETEWEK